MYSDKRPKRSMFVQFVVYFAVLLPLVFAILWKPSLLFEMTFELTLWGVAFSWIIFLIWDSAFSDNHTNPSWLVRFKQGGSIVHSVLLFGYAAYLFIIPVDTQGTSFVQGLLILGSYVLISFATGLKTKKLLLSYLISGGVFCFLYPFLIMGSIHSSLVLIILVTTCVSTYFGIDMLYRRSQIIGNTPVDSSSGRFLWGIFWTIFDSIVGIACAVLSIILGYLALLIFPQSMRAPTGFVWWSTGSEISGFGYVIGLVAGVLGVLTGVYVYSRFTDWADNITARTISTKFPSTIGLFVGIIAFIGIIVYSLFFL